MLTDQRFASEPAREVRNHLHVRRPVFQEPLDSLLVDFYPLDPFGGHRRGLPLGGVGVGGTKCGHHKGAFGGESVHQGEDDRDLAAADPTQRP